MYEYRNLRIAAPEAMVDPGLTMGDAEPQPDLLVGPYRTREKVDWSSLPGDILEQALAQLSLREVFRVRSVCKRWNALIHCAHFQERALRRERLWGPFHSPRFMWNGNSRAVGWSVFDLSEARWITTVPQLELPVCARDSFWILIAAGGGLLCFGAVSPRRGVLVCNPMTKAWRELPDVSLEYRAICAYMPHRPVVTHMVVDECGSTYKILLAGARKVDIYDSVANKWSAVELVSLGMIRFRSRAYCNGEIYLLGKMVSNGQNMVMVLELATLRWKEDTIPMPASSVKYPCIVAWSGEVYLVGASSEMPMESILLFRLDPGGRWTKVSEYANRRFSWSMGGIYGCGAHGGRIFVVTSQLHDYDLWVYKCATGVWEEPVKLIYSAMEDVFGTRFSFQPNLRVLP